MDVIDGSIGYTIADTRLGPMLVAATRRGVCQVAFASEEAADDPAAVDAELQAILHRRFPFAAAERDDVGLKRWSERLVAYVDGHASALDVPLDVGGTRFQREVWAALRRIPRGRTRSYGAIARDLGRARGARAVARACASNPVAVAIPCHRVVSEGGGTGGYAWGAARKRALLEAEGVVDDDAPCQR